MARPSSSVTTTVLHPISPGPAPAGPILGDQRGRLPCSPPALFPVPDLHGATTGWETSPHHHRSVASQPLYSRSTVPPGQPFHSCPGSPPASSHGGHRHFRGVHAHPHPAQSSPLPCLFIPESTLLFSSSPVRSQCGIVRIYQGPGLTTPHPSRPGGQYPCLSRRYCPLAPLSSDPSPACHPNPRETLCHGVPGQSPEVTTGATTYSPMAGHPMAPTDRTLAGVPQHQGQDPVVYPPAPSRRPRHPQASGGPGGSDQLCLSGAQPFASIPSTADSRSDPGLSPRQRHLSTHTPPLRRALQFWVDPSIWDYVPPFQITLPRLVLWTDASVIRKFHPRKFHPQKFHPRKFHPWKFHPAKIPPTKIPPTKIPPTKIPPMKIPPSENSTQRKFHPAKIPPSENYVRLGIHHPSIYCWVEFSWIEFSWNRTLHAQGGEPSSTRRPLHTRLGGHWRAALHINVLELRAVRRAILAFHLSSCHLVVYTDNETVRFALTHLRTRSLPLREELKSLLHDKIGRQVFLHPLRIPTTLNVVADWSPPPRTPQYGVDGVRFFDGQVLFRWTSWPPRPITVCSGGYLSSLTRMQWLATVSVSIGTASPAFTRSLQSVCSRLCCHSSSVIEVALSWWLPGTLGLLGCPFSSSRPEITSICWRPRTSSAGEARSSTGWGPPRAGPPFFFTEGPFSLPSSSGSRYAVSVLLTFLPTSAGSHLDGLSSLVAPWPFIGHQRRRPGLPAVPFFLPGPSPLPLFLTTGQPCNGLQRRRFRWILPIRIFPVLPLGCSTSDHLSHLWFPNGTCPP